MTSQGEEISSSTTKQRKPRALFLVMALAAVFLFAQMMDTSSSGKLQAGVLTSLPSQKTAGEVWATRALTASDVELILVSQDSIRPATPPSTVSSQVLGSLGIFSVAPRPEMQRYVVQEGDTPSSVAERFNISLNTVLWVNELSRTASLRPGQHLSILPVSGTVHLVRANDTLSEIASWYKANAAEIAEFNDLSSPQEIFAGDLLIIPGGTQPSSLPQGRLTPIANSYFIYPIPAPYNVTQGAHHYNAIDFSNGRCGEPVYAAAGGTVQTTGYQGAYGNFIRILHPNTVVTVYAHFSQMNVRAGERVLQGQIIGYTGNTGRTFGPTGCHLHFEVRGAVNPFLK
ncbi:MAG: peptidoglycan DD-metalloendopeptidase family protein [Candidatus Yanofskybacteria bacterium]|nr:peptidoglycan DD-metalloendopeptidase family protein [Candidatus Yanofskybacteria bacterium]